MRSLRHALRALAREWRSGELAVLWLSLAVAVAALSGVGFLVDRIGRAVTAQANQVLAADLRIQSAMPIPPDEAAQARRLGLRTAQLTTMLSAVFHGDSDQLTDVRAVTDGYPLLGHVKVAARPFAAGSDATGIPAPGQIWPDSRLAAALGVGIGGHLGVGARSLTVTRILISRPDQSSTFVGLAAAALINGADLPSTRLIQPGSRVNYALLLAGPRGALQAFKRWHAAHASQFERIEDVADASPQIGDAARRAERFLALASLVAVLLCAVAIAMGARSYVQRHLDIVALMKTLGASRRFVLGVSLWQLLTLALAASVVGAGVGWLTQLWLVQALQGLLRSNLPPPGPWPAVVGFAVALAMLAGFALPSLMQLTRVPALRVLRRDVGPPGMSLLFAVLPVVLTVGAVVYGALGQWRLSLWFVLGMAGAALALALAGIVLMRAAAHVRGHAGIAWRYGVASLARRRTTATAQIVAFGLGIMLLLALSILRDDLVVDWRRSLPTDTPNYFFVNIPPDERAAFRATLVAQGARLSRMLPMVRGRLLSVNGTPVLEFARTLARRGRRGGFARREQNLTWTARLGRDNRVIAGRFWSATYHGPAQVSLARRYSDALGLKLGDRLAFNVGGERIEATVTSIRRVKWDTFRPNFFVEFSPGSLAGAAGSYLTSAYFRPSSGAMAQLVHRFPSVSIFDIADLLGQARAVIDKAVVAVQSVFAFTVLASLTVLFAAVQASRDERRYETAILRVLGARRSMLLSSVLAEFSLMGLLAGVLAATGAALGGWWIAHELQLAYRFDVLIWSAGVLGSLLIVAAAGVLSTSALLRAAPRTSLY